MKVGVIGTGNIGGTLARKLSAAGHDVRVANSRGLEGVRAFADEIGATAVDTRGAVEGADVIVISIPFPAVAELPKDLFNAVPEDVPVVDTGNYYPGMRDTQIAEIDAGMPQSVWVPADSDCREAPSTDNSTPFTKLASSEARNSATVANFIRTTHLSPRD